MVSSSPASAYTELAIFDRLAVPGQVYETNEELKKGLINAYKEFLDEYKAVGGKIVQFDDCLWELFDPSNPTSFYSDGNGDLAELADEFVSDVFVSSFRSRTDFIITTTVVCPNR